MIPQDKSNILEYSTSHNFNTNSAKPSYLLFIVMSLLKRQEFFDYYKTKCPKHFKHKFNKNRICERCGMVSMAEWQLTNEGRCYYNTHSSKYEKVKIRKKILCTLNKITNDNFKIISEELVEIVLRNVNTQVQLREVVIQIFNKIVVEPNYMIMYVDLCSRLSNVSVKGEVNQNNRVVKRQRYYRHSFKKELLDIVMHEYKDQLKESISGEMSSMGKKKMVNSIHLIGELYVVGIVNFGIIHRYIQNTLYMNPCSDESLEALCKMISISGHKMDNSNHSKHLDDYLNKFDQIKNTKKWKNEIYYDGCHRFKKTKLGEKETTTTT